MTSAAMTGRASTAADMCEVCRYSWQGKGSLHCRRNPPQFHPGGSWLGQWPAVATYDWCGEFFHQGTTPTSTHTTASATPAASPASEARLSDGDTGSA